MIKTVIANAAVWYPPRPPEETVVVQPKPKPKRKAKPKKPSPPKKRGRPVGVKDSKPRKRVATVALPPLADNEDFFREAREELQAIRAGKIPARIRPRR